MRIAIAGISHARWIQGVAAAIVSADRPGLCTHKIDIFTRKRTQRPLWPVDAAADYPLSEDT